MANVSDYLSNRERSGREFEQVGVPAPISWPLSRMRRTSRVIAWRSGAVMVPTKFAYVDAIPCTPSNKIAKHELIAGADDLRRDAWDEQDQAWR